MLRVPQVYIEEGDASLNMRDIDKYTLDYNVENFEDYQIIYRRRTILKYIHEYKAKKILEIGCGMVPLFQYIDDSAYETYTIVEPSPLFCENAKRLSKVCSGKISCINGYFGDPKVSNELKGKEYDFIICASLLHEIEDVDNFCGRLFETASDNTVLHINVPNADSMHRDIAKCMGIIKDNCQLTERNIRYQQSRVFTKETLIDLLISSGFEILNSGTQFIKPFTHDQMFKMLESGIISERVLDGLYYLSELPAYKDIGSEIYCNVRKRS